MKDQNTATREPGTASHARHGYRNEVNWEGGSSRMGVPGMAGRQPYGNQGPQETPSPAAGEQVAEGNRAERSGRNQEQLERVKQKP